MDQEQLTTIEDVQKAMFAQSYIADRSLATAVFLALKRRKPLLLEGEPGVGKTEIAKVLAALLDTRLIRLQCYEGIDINTAVYEWNYTRQMLHIRLAEAQKGAQNGTYPHEADRHRQQQINRGAASTEVRHSRTPARSNASRSAIRSSSSTKQCDRRRARRIRGHDNGAAPR